MTAVVLSGAPGAHALPRLPAVKTGVVESFLKGVVFYGLLGGGMVIPFGGAILQAFLVG